MPNAALSDAIKEAYAVAPQGVVLLDTLEFRHASFTAPLRVVRNTVDIVATLESDAPENGGEAVTFTRFAFDFTLPEVSDGAAPELVIAIDNVNRLIVESLELAVASTDALYVTYRPYLSTDLTAPQMDPPLTMTVHHIEADVFRVTARCGFGDILNRAFPREDYTAARFPGLVSG